jgi:hypothetical protein
MANKTPSRIKNLSIAGVLALTGCLTTVIALGALFIGLWIDEQIGQRGLATVSLLLCSAPISLYLMVRIALALVRRLDPPAQTHVMNPSSQHEED